MYRHQFYILEGTTPIPCQQSGQWARWFETADRVVGRTIVNGVLISTVFLDIDHQFDEGAPILFETMIFTEIESLDFQTRYTTWEEAKTGHQLVVEQMRLALPVGSGMC